MKKIICAVRDITANVYANPFASHNPNTALRDFAHACKDSSSALFKNPEDYQLYKIADYDDDSGEMVGHPPLLLANATQFAQE